MKKSILKKPTVLFLIALLLVSCIACLIPVAASEGTPIGTAEELLTLMNTSSMWGGDYYLTADIDLSTYSGSLSPVPIGSAQSTAFTGTFDGQGHTVSGLDYSKYTKRTARIGFFGATNGAEIRNLTVEGTVSAAGQDIGGIVGLTYGKTVIENCVNNCIVSGKNNVGGIAGRTHNGADGTLIIDCINNGDVVGVTKNVGGIIGGVNNTEGPLTVNRCINTGDITGATNVGGVVGLFNATPSSGSTAREFYLTECVNSGTVTTTSASGVMAYAGGVVGNYMLSNISDCLNVGKVVTANGALAVGGVLGGNEKTGGTVGYCLDRGVVVNGGEVDRYIGQVVGYASTRPTSPCFYTTVSDGAAGGAGWNNVDAYLNFEFDIINTNGNWTVSENGPVPLFAKGKVEETVVKTVFGDTNDDKRINLIDVLRTIKALASDDTSEITDINYDGNINIADALEYIRVVINKGITNNYIAGDFVFLVAGNWAGNDFAATETETANVNKAIYERNKYMLDKYGVNIITKDVVASNSATGSGVGYDMLYAEYLAGTSEYDAAMISSQDVISAAYKGFLHDLNDIPTLDLTSDLWDQNILSDLDTYGRNYLATGDISYVDDASAAVMYFSNATLDAVGLESPYDLVRNDEWTFEKYYEMIKATGADLDGDGVYSAQTDRLGLLSDSANSLSMLNAADEKIADFVDGKLTLTFKNDKTIALYDEYQQLVHTPGYALNWERDDTYNTGDITDMMNDSRALFWSRTLLNYRTLKNGKVDYGIVPMPKYDDAQEGYSTRIDAYASQLLCVPETVENFGRTGKVLTFLAEQGGAVQDAYRTDIATSKAGEFDENIFNMLDLVMDSSSYDFGAILNPASISTLVQRLVYSDETLESVYNSKQELANIILDFAGLYYEEHEDTSVDKNFLRNFERYDEWFEETTSKGIEENRKGDAIITVVDANGNVIPNATVSVVQDTHEFRFGANIFMLDELETEEKNETYKEVFKDTFNMATLPFYWNANEPKQGQTRYDKDSEPMYRRPPIDLCMEFCEENNIEPRLHGLAYMYFAPNWYKNLTDEDEQYNLLEKRMKEIAERYGDKINTIEVTNETYRSGSVVEIYNDSDFVEWSFKTADKYFVNNQLGINEGDHVWEAPTTKARYYRQIRDTLASGGRIDAIGMQYHILDSQHDRAWKSSDLFYNPINIWETLNLYGSFGLPIQITEVTIPAYSNNPADEKLQAELLERVYTMWFAHPNVEQIIYWNVIDGYAHGTTPGDMTAGENQYYGGLLRFDMTPKPAYHTLKHLLEEEWHTEETVTSDENGVASFRGFYGEYTVEVEIDGVKTTHTVNLSKGAENGFTLEVK